MTILERMKTRYKELSGFDAEDNPEILERLVNLSNDMSVLYVHLEAFQTATGLGTLTENTIGDAPTQTT